MRPAITSNPQTTHSPIIKPLKPLIYNFFLSNKPETVDLSDMPGSMELEQLENSCYQSFHSQKLQAKTHAFFKPTIHSKKMVDQPKFLLSVERKKIKIINGISQRTTSEKPSRNSYRGNKLKTQPRILNHDESEHSHPSTRDKPITSQEHVFAKSPKKPKQPNLHFNLRHMLQTRKQFNLQFSYADNIKGSNFPYYSYFSSQKSSVPKTQRSSRDKSQKNCKQQSRYISSTMGVRTKPFLQHFQK